METVSFALFVLATATIFALLEVQIEGANGWASALPTWRVDNHISRLLMGGRPLTGYHFYLHIFLMLILHAPFALASAPWTFYSEVRIISFLVLFWLCEDFIYFIVNPAYGLRGFSKERVSWHPVWWWILPRDYWVFAPIGVGLYVWSRKFGG